MANQNLLSQAIHIYHEKTMWPPGYHHDGFVATHALGRMMDAHELPQRS